MKIIQSKVFVLESKENVSQSKVFAMDRLNVSVHFYFIKIVTFFVPNPLKEYNNKKKKLQKLTCKIVLVDFIFYEKFRIIT